VCHVYGQDKKVVFDRRGSVHINDESIVNVCNFPYWREKFEGFIILEIGYVQYLIKITTIKMKETSGGDKFISCLMHNVHTFRNNTHYFDNPISIIKVEVRSRWKSKTGRIYIINDNFKDIISYNSYNEGRIIEMPILARTQLTKLISADEIWKELQNYISSLNNDKDILDTMTDVEKAETHGFDKQTSFRHPIK